MKTVTKIGFWGYPNPKQIKKLKTGYPEAEWIDLDIDFNYPNAGIIPEASCKIIRNIIDNAVFIKPDLILAPIGKDKCDSGWFTSKILQDLGFNVIQTIFEDLNHQKKINICRSNLPLREKVLIITGNIVQMGSQNTLYEQAVIPAKGENPSSNINYTPGFWGVPPNDLSILDLFPDTTHVYGWLRCVEAGTPADIDLEMYVNPDVPTIFYAQAFCAKSQLAKYLANKYNGLYIDINDYATASIKAKIEAFLRLN